MIKKCSNINNIPYGLDWSTRQDDSRFLTAFLTTPSLIIPLTLPVFIVWVLMWLGLFWSPFVMSISTSSSTSNNTVAIAKSDAAKTCFNIDKVEYVDIKGQLMAPSWQVYARKLPLILPACMSVLDINPLVSVATAKLLEDGWVTARLGVVDQDLNTGTLQLTLVLGTLDRVLVEQPLTPRRWQPAIASHYGEPIQLDDIEQTLEQLNRLASQKADIQVIPGQQQGTSDWALTIQDQASRIRGSLGANDYQPNQLAAGLILDRPLGTTDQLNINVTQTLDEHTSGQTQAIDWSMGVGYNTYQLAANRSRNRRTIFGAVETFISESHSDGWQLGYTRRLYRNQNTLLDLTIKAAQDSDHSFIDGTEIDVQARQQGWLQAELKLSKTFDNSQWSLLLAQQQGSPQLWGDDDPQDLPADRPTHRYTLDQLTISRTHNWALDADAKVSWASTATGQHSMDALHGANLFSLGGRTSVRGFLYRIYIKINKKFAYM